MGRYVWRKSEIVQPEISVTNPTGTVITYQDYSLEGSFGFKFTADDSRVDFTNWSFDQVCGFLNGFVASNGTDAFALSYNGSSLLLLIGTRSYYVATKNSTNIISQNGNTVIFEPSTWSAGILNRPMIYNGTKKLQERIVNPLSFVVSNNADQYPDGGEYYGYWYELIGSITSANALSLSNLSADTMRDISVEEIQKGVTNVD